jgi:hypothetical protein
VERIGEIAGAAGAARAFVRAAWVLVVLVAAHRTATAQGENFLIVERPERLLFVNRYQQQLKGEERKALLPFTPFRILAEHDLLGDGFTPCMKVEADGSLYYVLKDDSGELAGVRDAGTVKTVRNATSLRDSVEIVSAKGIVLWDVQERTKRTLPRGAILVRRFSLNSMTYVQALPSMQYGWVRLDTSRGQTQWRVVPRGVPRPTEELARVLPAIVQRVEEVNAKLRRLFDHLNAKTSQHLPAPSWHVQRLNTGIVCSLETSLPVEQFRESSLLLAKRIESTVLGTTLRVYAVPGTIHVR